MRHQVMPDMWLCGEGKTLPHSVSQLQQVRDPAAAFRKVGPACFLGSILELTLLMPMLLNWPHSEELGGSDTAPHLLYGHMGEGEMPPQCTASTPSGAAGPENIRVREWSCPSPAV